MTIAPPLSPAATGAPMTGPVRRLASRLRGLRDLSGWRRAAAAMVAGAFGALAMPPFGVWPALAVSFPVLVLLLDGTRGRLWPGLKAAAGIGWAFGFGYFLASLWWIGAAFLVEADVFAWLLPFAVLAMPAGLGLFTAFGAVLARLLWSEGPLRLFAFAFAFTTAEWLRGHVLTGFPWNTFGYAFAQWLPLTQSAALVGAYGLTFFALLLLATPVLTLSRRRWERAGILAAALLIATAAAWGATRLNAETPRFVPDVRLRIMQPDLPQDQKFNYSRRQDVLASYLTQSAEASATYPNGLQDVTVLIWPESALPFIYEREPWAAAAIAATLPANVTLVTGAVRYGAPPKGQHSPFFNSVRVIDHDGNVLRSTDKSHLVPFGEYLPLQDVLEQLGVEQLTRVRGGFSAAGALRALEVPGLPRVAPLVCYEIIFPGNVIPQGERPQVLLNLTNDGWFGLTPGPYQHFVQARLRAVEEGLPLVRAANTGISAIIDPMGRIVAMGQLGARTLVDGPLPQALETLPLAAVHAKLVLLWVQFSSLLLALLPLAGRIARKS
ncbi:apolipoprotein N-acyltransferase [Xanthobacter agilis]|uniref:Apolipoprotein N-acyltransferase n=1 Tax=Xanthobacter agilis TaxID=47492 RepID=A0ABU0LF60_XANAG|nr:apolipoprotein N-acyltransferase [Xanthobacter agilis]MDQ0505777.1 apolipoprotein N-acyltransferase [Xanthobacter agilis]